MSLISSRRDVLRSLAATGVGVASVRRLQAEEREPAISPTEDLMQEHGVLDRILLIYEEAIRRLEAKGAPPPYQAIAKSTDIIRRFIEDYHEKNEEMHVFPRLEKAGKLVDTVAILRQQHERGRELTSQLHIWSRSENVSGEQNHKRMAEAMRSFIRMYRPHAAREDTEVFRAFRELLSPKQTKELGEQFEETEHKLFGKNGFESILGEVVTLEKELGINDLGQFTPR